MLHQIDTIYKLYIYYKTLDHKFIAAICSWLRYKVSLLNNEGKHSQDVAWIKTKMELNMLLKKCSVTHSVTIWGMTQYLKELITFTLRTFKTVEYFQLIIGEKYSFQNIFTKTIFLPAVSKYKCQRKGFVCSWII